MKIRRSEERGLTKIVWLTSYHSFSFGNYYDPEHSNFRSLRVINDDYIAPDSGFGFHPHRNMEIVTYIISGELTHEDSLGSQSVLRAGEIQRMSAGKGIMHSERNESSDTPVRLLQIWITPERNGIAPSYEEKKVIAAGKLTPLVSSEEAEGTLKIHQDASIHLLKLCAGEQHLFHCAKDKGVWIQIFEGSLVVNSEVLHDGDAVSFEDGEEVSLTTAGGAQALLFSVI